MLTYHSVISDHSSRLRECPHAGEAPMDGLTAAAASTKTMETFLTSPTAVPPSLDPGVEGSVE